jgi:hypothetical protein
MKKCPFCAEIIKDEAIVCRHCGREIDPDAVKLVKGIQKHSKYMRGDKKKWLLPFIVLLLIGLIAIVGIEINEEKAMKLEATADAIRYLTSVKQNVFSSQTAESINRVSTAHARHTQNHLATETAILITETAKQLNIIRSNLPATNQIPSMGANATNLSFYSYEYVLQVDGKFKQEDISYGNDFTFNSELGGVCYKLSINFNSTVRYVTLTYELLEPDQDFYKTPVSYSFDRNWSGAIITECNSINSSGYYALSIFDGDVKVAKGTYTIR